MVEIVRAFNHVIEKGLAFYWGTSEWTAAQIEEATGIANSLGLIPPSCDQPHYSMLHREKVEVEFADLYKKYKVSRAIPFTCFVYTADSSIAVWNDHLESPRERSPHRKVQRRSESQSPPLVPHIYRH
jgi:hypothetical protein